MFSWALPKHLPIVVAHRGSSAAAPENTLQAFVRAIDEGADAIELDVRLTRDNRVVVIHDSRLEGTTDGYGRVRDSVLSDLKALRAGFRSKRTALTEKIPTLGEVFDIVRGKIGVNIEIKADRHGGRSFEIVRQCIGALNEFRASSSVLVSSFHAPYLARMKRLAPAVNTGLLYHPLIHLGRKPLPLARSIGASHIIFGRHAFRKTIVEAAHDRNLLVGVYTINAEEQLSKALRYGIDMIYSDNPGLIVRLLQKR